MRQTSYLKPSLSGFRGTAFQFAHVPPLRPAGKELAALAVLTALYYFADDLGGQDIYEFLDWIGPLSLVGILAYGAIRLVRQDRNALWAPLLWFRVATAVYYGIGSVAPFLVNITTFINLQDVGYFDASDMLKFNLLMTLGVLVVLLTAYAFETLVSRWRWTGAQTTPRQMLIFALAFYLAGAGIKYLIALPYAMGLQEGVVAGAVVQAGALVYVGIFLFTLWTLTYSRKLFPIAVAMVAIDSLIGLLLFSKTDVLLALIAFTLAVFLRGATPLRLAITGIAYAYIFVFLQPIITYGRADYVRQFGQTQGAGLSDRLMIIAQYIKNEGSMDSALSSSEDVQNSWTRIAYIAWGTRVIGMYDRGVPGNSLSSFWTAFVPRFLWPNKPIMTSGGEELYTLVTGYEGTAVSAGIVAEAYWNYGWLGLVTMVVPWALILTLTSRLALWVIATERWAYMPALFLALRMGSRVDGLYLPDVVGPSVLLVVMIVAAAALQRVIRTP